VKLVKGRLPVEHPARSLGELTARNLFWFSRFADSIEAVNPLSACPHSAPE
jgi:hypothetical protein